MGKYKSLLSNCVRRQYKSIDDKTSVYLPSNASTSSSADSESSTLHRNQPLERDITNEQYPPEVREGSLNQNYHDLITNLKSYSDYDEVQKIEKNEQTRVCYSSPYYVPNKCSSLTCSCHIQEKMFSNTIKLMLPKKDDVEAITKKFSQLAVEWAKSIYECAPCYRCCCKIITTLNYLYVIGGSNPNVSTDALQDVWRFNLLTRRWKQIENIKNLPTALISYSIEWNSNYDYVSGYLFGGAVDYKGLKLSNKLYRFTIDEDSNIVFTELYIQENGALTPRCGSSIVVVENNNHEYVYVVGGADRESQLFDVWRVDTKAKVLVWEKLFESPDINKRRYMHDVVYHNNKLILFGGGTKKTCFGFEELDIIDLNDHKPSTITTQGPAPTPRKFQSVVSYCDEVFVIGGWSDTPKGPILSNEVWKLNLYNMTWSKCSTSLKMPHFFHASSITSDGCLYTFGGCIDKSMYPSNKLQRAWIRPPKLQYLAMFSFLTNNADLAKDENMKYSETIKFMQEAVHY